MKPIKPNTNRIPRVNSLIQQKLGEVLREFLDGEKGLTTISKVETTRDLKHAKVWLSIIPIGNPHPAPSPKGRGESSLSQANNKTRAMTPLDEKILKLINDNIYDIQGALNSAMNTKIFPRLSFHLDTSPRYVEHVDELIKKIHDEGNSKS